jgi:cobalamin biosynthetic protein CobC
MLEHGGGLRAASRRYGIALDAWIDLSTGIAPWPYPVPAIPPEVWQRLPENDDGLIEAAQAYYGTDRLMAVNGSQAAILALPRVFAPCKVAVLAPGYSEYAPAWRAAGHAVCAGAAVGILDSAADIIMLANPNNPDGTRFARQELLAAAERLRAGRRWLIVDEAFSDADDEHALVHLAGTGEAPNLIVLRSLGKFFGLAGARIGFCAARPEMFVRLGRQIGPWPLSHPARYVAKAALGDTAWQATQKQKLCAASARLAGLLATHGLAPCGGTALFQYVRYERAAALHEFLAQRGLLVRHFDQPSALRFGLPENETAWTRLADMLGQWRTP